MTPKFVLFAVGLLLLTSPAGAQHLWASKDPAADPPAATQPSPSAAPVAQALPSTPIPTAPSGAFLDPGMQNNMLKAFEHAQSSAEQGQSSAQQALVQLDNQKVPANDKNRTEIEKMIADFSVQMKETQKKIDLLKAGPVKTSDMSKLY